MEVSGALNAHRFVFVSFSPLREVLLLWATSSAACGGRKVPAIVHVGKCNEEDEGRGGMRSGEIDLVFFGFLCIYFIDRYGVLYLGLLLVTGDKG